MVAINVGFPGFTAVRRLANGLNSANAVEAEKVVLVSFKRICAERDLIQKYYFIFKW